MGYKTKPEIYLALHVGLKPADLILKGIAPATAYKYSAKYQKEIKPAFEKLIRK